MKPNSLGGITFEGGEIPVIRQFSYFHQQVSRPDELRSVARKAHYLIEDEDLSLTAQESKATIEALEVGKPAQRLDDLSQRIVSRILKESAELALLTREC
jgi:hypothetical protein